MPHLRAVHTANSLRAGWPVCAALACLLAAAPARAQTGPKVPNSASQYGAASNPACIDTISSASLPVVVVYQHELLSVVSPGLEAQASLLGQQVAGRVRATLGDSGSVSRNDSLVDWRSLDGTLPLRIVIRRDQSNYWYVDSTADSAKARLTAVYARVLRTFTAADLQMVWPSSLATDSAVLRFYVNARPSPSQNLTFDYAFPILAMKAPRETTPHLLHPMRPDLPMSELRKFMDVSILLEGNLDTAGRIEPATLHDVKPPELPKDDRFGADYRNYLNAIRADMLAARFSPARIGGCPVRQLVQLPVQVRTLGMRVDPW